MVDDKKPRKSIVPEVVRTDSRALEKRDEQPTLLSRFAMQRRKVTSEKETELLEAIAKNQEARLKVLRAVERLKEPRLATILDGDAARDAADYLAAANAVEEEVDKADLAKERANTAKLREQNEQAKLRADLAENEARLVKARVSPHVQTEHERVRADFDARFGKESAIRAEAQRRIEEVLRNAGGEVTPEVALQIKNINDYAQHKIDKLP